MRISQLNYFQIKILLSLYYTRQGHQTANELGITPSTVSRALNTMREIFSDSLFVRRSTGLVPTEKTKKIIPYAECIAKQYELLEQDYSHFNPATSTGQYSIYAYDEFIYATQKVVTEKIIPLAPNLRVTVKNLGYDYTKDLCSGEIDFAITRESFEKDKLKYDMFSKIDDIYIMCRDLHPLNTMDINLENISKFSVVELDNYNELCSPILVELCRKKSIDITVDYYTDSLANAMQILNESDCITLCCNQFTKRMTTKIPGLICLKLENEIVSEIKGMRSLIRTAGNYVLYGETNKSISFNWMKSKLVDGLSEEWDFALNNN